MKTKLTLILLFCSLWGHGQTVFNQGGANQAVHNLGAFWVDSAWRLPVRGLTTIYPNVPDLGTLQINSANNKLYYHNGSAFIQVIDGGTYTSFFNTDFSGKTTSDLAEGSNLYFTDLRARSAFSLTNIGSGGAPTYSNLTGILNIPSYPGTVTSVGVSSTDFSVSGSPITTSGSFTLNLNTSGVSANTYNGRYTVNSKGIITAAVNQIDSTETRSFNSAFRPSLTRDCDVNYTVEISTTSLLIGTNGGEVFLETSPDNSNWTTKDKAKQYITGVASTQVQGSSVRAFVPTGYYVRLRTATTGANGATFTYVTGWKKLY